MAGIGLLVSIEDRAIQREMKIATNKVRGYSKADA
jgi:hypothetical protein